MSMENGLEALAKAISDATASFESLVKALEQSKTQCGYIKPKHTRPIYGKGKKPCDGFKAAIRTREGFRK